jgi:hypothetical protein
LFQQQLGSLIGAWMLAGLPFDPRLELGKAHPKWLRFETEAPVDDILVATSEEGFVAIQAKTTLNSSKNPKSVYFKTVEQFLRHWLACREGNGSLNWNRPLSPSIDRLVLAVGPRTPDSIKVHLSSALKLIKSPGIAKLSKAQNTAIDVFKDCVNQIWPTLTSETLSEKKLHEFLRLISVITFDPDNSNLAATLAASVIDTSDTLSTVHLMSQYSGELMSRRGGADLAELRNALSTRGARLQAEPQYKSDINELKRHSSRVQSTLRRYEVIDAGLGDPINIHRDCQASVVEAALEGSLLIVGEPGAGKSGVLNALARNLENKGFDVLELAVDHFSVETLEGLRGDLKLSHSLLNVLDAWDGPQPAWVIIDALDATRGGKGEGVFRTLIDQILMRKNRWRVVASIRTFDLKMGQQYRKLFKGNPPNQDLSEHGFSDVRHIRIPSWSPSELDQVLQQAPHLAAILSSDTPRLRELAAVPFNTKLLAELVSENPDFPNLNHITTQAHLLKTYWSDRVEKHGVAAETCLRRIVSTMVMSRTLRAPRLDAAEADPSMVQTLCLEGVLIVVEGNRWIQFRHHLLFDYAASQVYIDPSRLLVGTPLFPKSESLGLMLAPALTFVLRELWSNEGSHDQFWQAIVRLLADENADPVIRSLASRIAVELPFHDEDAIQLSKYIDMGNESALTALSHIIGALAVRFEDDKSLSINPWVRLAEMLAQHVSQIAWQLRLLIFLLIERVSDQQRGALGKPARALLQYGFSIEAPHSIVSAAIGFVADTYATEPTTSKNLLHKIFNDERFDVWGWEEVPAIARKISVIANADPDFAIEIYRETYTKKLLTERETNLGGSQILPLRSNARQDFETAKYSLSEYLPSFLEFYPKSALGAFVAAVDGFVARSHTILETDAKYRIDVEDYHVILCDDGSNIWAHDPDNSYSTDGETLISHFLTKLRGATEPEAIFIAKYIISIASLAIYWSRLFLAAAERDDALTDFLWPFACQEAFLRSLDTRKDAIDVIATGWSRRSSTEQTSFENTILRITFPEYISSKEIKHRLLSQIFKAIGKNKLSTPVARKIADAAADDFWNERPFTVRTSWVDAADPFQWIADRNKDTPKNKSLIDAIQTVKLTLNLEASNTPNNTSLHTGISALQQLITVLDSLPDVNDVLRNAAEGLLGEGIGKIVKSKPIHSESNASEFEKLVYLIEYLSRSQYPIVDAATETNFEEHASWGGPAPRVDAAQAALELTYQQPSYYKKLAPLIDKFLADPHPAVRLQASLYLVRIWDIDREGFWIRVNDRARKELNTSVIVHFSSSILGRTLHSSPKEVENIALLLLSRFNGSEKNAIKIRKSLADSIAILVITYQLSASELILNKWISEIESHADEIRHVLTTLRGAVILGLKKSDNIENSEAIRHRAQLVFKRCIEQANRLLSRYYETSEHTESQKIQATKCASIIDTACSQLFYASEANSSQHESEQQLSEDNLRAFFNEIQPTLKLIGDYGSPHTIYYLLQLLEKLIVCDPGPVFDLSAHALLNGGQRSGYQYESMGSDLMVRMIGVFLADHKVIFNNDARSVQLIECLETFLKAGWPAARRLLYRLPDLIQ